MNIGFVVLLGVRPELGRPHRYTEMREMAAAAEDAGFDSIWLYDHLLYRSPAAGGTRGIWECWTILSALAEATDTAELGTLVLCNQFRNPAILAKMAVTLDEVSDGRFILGIGAGWNEPEFRAFGITFDHRVSRLDEALQIIAPLLRTGRVDFAGEYYTARDCEITPRGPRPQGPPLLVAGSGPRMMRLTAKYADLWNPSEYITTPAALAAQRVKLDEACGDAGRSPLSIGLTAHVPLSFPDLGAPPASTMIPAYLSGTTEEVAAAMHDLDRTGASHLMFYCAPYSIAVLERLADAVRIYRDQAARGTPANEP